MAPKAKKPAKKTEGAKPITPSVLKAKKIVKVFPMTLEDGAGKLMLKKGGAYFVAPGLMTIEEPTDEQLKDQKVDERSSAGTIVVDRSQPNLTQENAWVVYVLNIYANRSKNDDDGGTVVLTVRYMWKKADMLKDLGKTLSAEAAKIKMDERELVMCDGEDDIWASAVFAEASVQVLGRGEDALDRTASAIEFAEAIKISSDDGVAYDPRAGRFINGDQPKRAGTGGDPSDAISGPADAPASLEYEAEGSAGQVENNQSAFIRLPRIKFTEEKKRRVTEEEEGKKGKKASRA